GCRAGAAAGAGAERAGDRPPQGPRRGSRHPARAGAVRGGARELMERIGLYPGTFEPVTRGQPHIIRRGAKLVDRLIIGVTTNPSKDPMFAPDERIEMVRAEVARQGLANVEVVGFNALLMTFAEKVGASVIVRGLRAVADFEYEYQMAGM